MLPPDAEIKVYLEDVSRMDVPADILASTTLPSADGPPWCFSMEYDPARIDSRHPHHYALRARIEKDGRLLFINTSRVPAFDQAEGEPVEVLVSRVGQGRGGQQAAAVKPDASLVNTYWKLVVLSGRPVTLGAGNKELHMVLNGEGGTVQGFSGCNSFRGTYVLTGNQLRFMRMGSTMRACVDGMEQEAGFLKALAKSEFFEIRGDTLSLYDAENRRTLKFAAIYLP